MIKHSHASLDDYKLQYDAYFKDTDDSMIISIDHINSTSTTRPFELYLFAHKSKESKFALGNYINFNYIKM